MAAVFFSVVSYQAPQLPAPTTAMVIRLSGCPGLLTANQPQNSPFSLSLSVRLPFIFSTKSHFLLVSSPPACVFFYFFHSSFFTSLVQSFHLSGPILFIECYAFLDFICSTLYENASRQQNIFNVLQVGVWLAVPDHAACIFILTTQHHILFTCAFDKYTSSLPCSSLPAPSGNAAGDGQTNGKIYLFIIFLASVAWGRERKGRGG